MAEDPPYTLRGYQQDDLAFHIGAKKSLNLSDPGAGKTGVVCVAAYYYWSRLGVKTIWAMPKSLLEKNKEEFGLFTDFTPDDIHIFESDFAALTKDWTGPTKTRTKITRALKLRRLDGTVTNARDYKPGHPLVYSSPMKKFQGPGWAVIGKTDTVSVPPANAELVFPILDPFGKPQFERFEDEETVKDLIAAHADKKVFLCSFEFLREHWSYLLNTIPEIGLYLVDELHMGYGGAESGRTESFYHVNRHCDYFIGMTGTLMDGRMDTCYPAIHVIEPRYYGSYQGFLDNHAGFTDNYGNVQVWTNHEKLKSILDRHSVRHTFEEVYGEEPVHFETKVIPMGPKVREVYDQFHDDAMLELEDESIIDGSMPGVTTIRARQIMSHPETMGLAKGETTGKDKLLAAYAVEGQPMLVFASLKPEQERCKRVLEEQGLRVGLINSDTSLKERGRIDRLFRLGELDAIVGSGPTVAVGFNFQRADHVVFISIDYKDVNIMQAYRRASRGTRTTTLRVTFIQYEKSIDQRMYNIVSMKSQEANKVDHTRKVLDFTQ